LWSGDSLFCRFRTADSTLLTLRRLLFQSSCGKATAFITNNHTFLHIFEVCVQL